MNVQLHSTRLLTGTTYRVRGTVDGVITTVDADLGATPTDQDAIDALERGAARNETGGSLAAGTLVYISGWDEATLKPLIAKADANASGARARYVLRAAIANNANGYVHTSYRIEGVNTAGASEGDPVYLSETPGGWTLTAPTGAGAIRQIVGRVAVVDATTGVVEIDINNNQVTIGGRELQAGIIKVVTVAGGAAGAITVTGIAVGDELVAVINLADGVNLTSEFTVSDADEIDNTDGTATTSDQLLVVWVDKT